VTVPLGGAGSGSLRPWLVTSPVGVVPSLIPSPENGEAEGASRNAAVEQFKCPLGSKASMAI
jgi:hypothetical protein